MKDNIAASKECRAAARPEAPRANRSPGHARTQGRVGWGHARGAAGVETSVDKLQMTAADKVLGDACLDVLGPFAASPEGAPHGTNAFA